MFTSACPESTCVSAWWGTCSVLRLCSPDLLSFTRELTSIWFRSEILVDRASGLDVTWHVSSFPSVVIFSLPQHPGFDKPLWCFWCLLEFENPCFQVNCLQWDTSIYQRASSLVLGGNSYYLQNVGNSYYLQNVGSIAHLGISTLILRVVIILCVSGFMCLACGTWCICVCVCVCILVYTYTYVEGWRSHEP